MLEPVKCPACKATLFESEGVGTTIRKICRCGRVIHVDRFGVISVHGDKIAGQLVTS